MATEIVTPHLSAGANVIPFPSRSRVVDEPDPITQALAAMRAARDLRSLQKRIEVLEDRWDRIGWGKQRFTPCLLNRLRCELGVEDVDLDDLMQDQLEQVDAILGEIENGFGDFQDVAWTVSGAFLRGVIGGNAPWIPAIKRKITQKGGKPQWEDVVAQVRRVFEGHS